MVTLNSDRDAPSTIEISNLASHDEVLRSELAGQPEPSDALGDLFENLEDRFSAMAPLFPEDRETVLRKPLSETLQEIAAWRSGVRASDQEIGRIAAPTPAVLPQADEPPFADAALDKECRAQFTTPPEVRLSLERARRELDERRAALGLPPMPDIPDFEPVFHNVTVNMSPEWGPVWRANMTMDAAAAHVARMRCWRSRPGKPARAALSWDPPFPDLGEEP
jgi:hypothetical protein